MKNSNAHRTVVNAVTELHAATKRMVPTTHIMDAVVNAGSHGNRGARVATVAATIDACIANGTVSPFRGNMTSTAYVGRFVAVTNGGRYAADGDGGACAIVNGSIRFTGNGATRAKLADRVAKRANGWTAAINTAAAAE